MPIPSEMTALKEYLDSLYNYDMRKHKAKWMGNNASYEKMWFKIKEYGAFPILYTYCFIPIFNWTTQFLTH